MTRFRRVFAEDELHMVYVKTAAAIEELRRVYALLEQAERLAEHIRYTKCASETCTKEHFDKAKEFLEALEKE